jgi:hypothetical protein
MSLELVITGLLKFSIRVASLLAGLPPDSFLGQSLFIPQSKPRPGSWLKAVIQCIRRRLWTQGLSCELIGMAQAGKQ